MSTDNQRKNNIEIIQDNNFSYEGFQVVRGEFFSHIYEPSFTFNHYKVSVNTACIKRLPDFDYIQILVNPEEKKLAVKPCREEEKDSFRWCSATSKRSPKQITCRVFFAKVMSLMSWNPDYRYKLLGKLIQSNDEILFVFDLNAPEIYKRSVKNEGRTNASRIPSYPEDWKTQFGVPVSEHKAVMQINTFDSYAIFGLQKEQSAKKRSHDHTPTTDAEDAALLPSLTPSEETISNTHESEESPYAKDTGQKSLNFTDPAFHAH
ncbi:MAG: integrase [Eubacteriales bacterium]|nr:integrase [Eubacteriales bacterium]